MEVPCQCLKFCSWSGTTIQLTETGYDYFDSKERQRQTFYKGFARRLEQILPYLIHPNQNSFIKGRSIVDAVRTVEDVLEFAQFTDCSGILLTVDFEKAFDSLNHTILLKVLKKYNFGTYFLQWIKTFYTNVSSCVLNNGLTTDLFPSGAGLGRVTPCHLYYSSLLLKCSLVEFMKAMKLKVNWFRRKKSN